MKKIACGIVQLLLVLALACSPPQVPPPIAEDSGQSDSTTQPLLTHAVMHTDQGIFIGTKDERFGIMLPPGFPEPGLQRQQEEGMTATVYMSKKDDKRVALFGWNTYDDMKMNDVSGDYLLQYAVEQAMKQMEGRVSEHNLMKMDGWSGSQAWITAGSGDSRSVARYEYWLIPPYLFQIGYMTPDSKELEMPEISSFFGSFRFGGAKASSAKIWPAEIPIIF